MLKECEAFLMARVFNRFFFGGGGVYNAYQSSFFPHSVIIYVVTP